MEKYIRRPNCNCKVCNKEIYRRPNQLENSSNVFCGYECYSKWCTILIKCSVCGTEYRSGLHKKTCSKACANKLKIGSHYNSGRPIKDVVKTQQALKNRLITLRGCNCEKCGCTKTSILNVHHKIRKVDGGSDDLDNLQLICPNCHAEIHYGNKKD
jgi:hypothetical protein